MEEKVAKNKKAIRIMSVIIALTLVVIWGHSCMSKEDSSEESGFVFELLCPFFEIFMGKGNVTELFIRKMAHFTEFTVLGFELRLFLNMLIPSKGWVLLLYSWVTGTFCALIDETVQLFSDRGSEISDVWLDSAGCLTGVLVMTLIIKILDARKRKKA